ncbi:MAG: hypothetical protein M1817_004324 [Caeruleum heppii]|nr:MAG: hypothetical protein M1817_004324 [Caeruleum heppii]
MAETVRVIRRTTRYHWPDGQLNFWLLIFLVGSATILGIHAFFMSVQSQLEVGIPWYFPFWVATGSLGVLFVLIIIYLTSSRQLIPGIVMLGSFILFVLYLTGLIKESIELWGPQGSVNQNCQRYVYDQASRGQSIYTLAYLEQANICNCWKAAWSFELVCTVFLLWMMIMAYQVQQENYD